MLPCTLNTVCPPVATAIGSNNLVAKGKKHASGDLGSNSHSGSNKKPREYTGTTARRKMPEQKHLL